MGRQTVYAYDGPLVGDQRRVGWFDLDAATAYDEGSWWNASYGTTISRAPAAPLSKSRYTAPPRAAGSSTGGCSGKRRLDRWSFATDGYACDWLLANGHDAAAEEYFGPIEPKRGPGRPPIGRPIQVRLPVGLLARLDTFAGELNRAEAVRILLNAGLVNAEQVDHGSTNGNRR